jgi:hypothetical protein
VADHVLPALVVLGVSVWALVRGGRATEESLDMLTAGLAILLAGFWMAATHLPLVLQALRHEAPWPATIHHSTSAVVVFAYGATWTILHWNAGEDDR